ncbi:hypothetical protein SO802_024378 [Lithocarpus litseifolius]|uniref:Transmembrane protein n=1 Tax=Lithocarpus litseifolius TaxID=425828 RepID=A0AAW2CCE1_9ROSI
MEASVLGGQHRSEKTMGNTASPPCVCCETQIGGSGCGFLPRHSPPPATTKGLVVMDLVVVVLEVIWVWCWWIWVNVANCGGGHWV